MKRKLTLLIALFTLSINVAIVTSEKNEVVNATYSTNASTYYSSITNESGDALLEKLASLSKTNHKYYNTYEECRTMSAKSDKDSSNSSNFIDFYSRASLPATWDSSVWNREHVWCKSLSNGLYTSIAESGKGAGADIHQIRASNDNINSSRNNSVYGNVASRDSYKRYYDKTKDSAAQSVTSGTHWGYMKSGVFEPLDNVKGDVARILMYMYMHYSKEVSANSSHSYAGNLKITDITSATTDAAAWDMLVAWSETDKVDDLEEYRNEYCAGVTGVRNPFVDHPEYAKYIWGGESNSGSSSGGSTDSGDSGNSGDSGSSDTGSSGGTVVGDTVVIPGTTTTTTTTTTYYRRLSSANGITSGSKIIIAASDYDRALSKNQKDTARGYTAISKYTSDGYECLTPSSNTAIFTVGGSSSAWTLKDSVGYLAATSSSADELKSRSSATGNATWAINFSSGKAKVVSQGSYTHNLLKYYHSGSEFICVKSDDDRTSLKDIAIYKEYEKKVTTSVTTPDTVITLPTGGSEITISKANEVANLVGSNYTNSKYKITGTIDSIANTTYGNMTIKDSSGNSIYVYGTYSADGSTLYSNLATMDQPQVGDTVTLYGVLGTYNSSPQMKSGWIVDLNKSASVSEELQTLFTNYVGDGTYTKKSVINLTEDAQHDIAKYFLTSSSSLKRTTYYNGNSLLMANYDGTLKGVDSNSGINSGYGTDSNGNMTHFRINSDGTKNIDYTVTMAGKGGMEEFYVTPKDFAASNYFSSGWTYEYGTGYVYDFDVNGSSSAKSIKYLEDFIDVAAPLLLDKIYTSNYVQITKLIVKEVNGTLVLQLMVSPTNEGALADQVIDKYVLAESVITPDCDCSYL